MSNINFVPDDYVQNNESRRANLMCLVLFSVVMAVLGGSFVMIKISQRACSAQESLVNAKMVRMHDSIKKFEELQTKRKEMMRTALTTAELLEPVPRSVVLASLTNSLPPGVSLLKVGLVQKELKQTAAQASAAKTKYQAAQEHQAGPEPEHASAEKQLETHMEIEGVSPSDLQVAAYIERLGNSVLLTDVALVESKEKKVEKTSFRQFKLTAVLRPEVHLTKEDVEAIKSKAAHSVYQF
jgi:Tfp pilus assembly protein PilN